MIPWNYIYPWLAPSKFASELASDESASKLASESA